MKFLKYYHLSECFLVELLSPSCGFFPGDQVLFSFTKKPHPDNIVVLAYDIGSPWLLAWNEAGPAIEKGADKLGTVIEVYRLDRGFITKVLKDQNSLDLQAGQISSNIEQFHHPEISVSLAEITKTSLQLFRVSIALIMTWTATSFLIYSLGRYLI